MTASKNTRNTNNHTRNNINHLDVNVMVTDVESNTFDLHLKTGIVKSLYEKGVLTQNQMEQAIKKIQMQPKGVKANA